MAKDQIKLQNKVKDFESVSKSLHTLEVALNKLLAKTTQEAEYSSTLGYEGETGESRIINNPDKTYSFNIRTEDGWKTPVWKGSEITFKDKPKKEKIVKKSIETIITEDTSTGNTDAQNTIYDENSGQFRVNHLTGVPRPDYDSGWGDMDRTDADKDNFTLAHGLTFSNSSPTLVICWMKDSYGDYLGNSPTNMIYPWKRWTHDTGEWRGADWRIDSTNLYIQAYTSYYILWNNQDDSGGVGTHKYWNRIDGRVLMWK